MDNFSTLIELLIKEEMEGRPSHERVVILGDTPRYLREKAGFPDLKIAMTGKVVSKACFDHGIPTSMLKRLPKIIESPKSLFHSANVQMTDSVVVITLEFKQAGPIIIPMRREVLVGRQKYNVVSSIYAKEGPDPAIKWKGQGLLIHEWE